MHHIPQVAAIFICKKYQNISDILHIICYYIIYILLHTICYVYDIYIIIHSDKEELP
jgi:hypothetical protein